MNNDMSGTACDFAGTGREAPTGTEVHKMFEDWQKHIAEALLRDRLQQYADFARKLNTDLLPIKAQFYEMLERCEDEMFYRFLGVPSVEYRKNMEENDGSFFVEAKGRSFKITREMHTENKYGFIVRSRLYEVEGGQEVEKTWSEMAILKYAGQWVIVDKNQPQFIMQPTLKAMVEDDESRNALKSITYGKMQQSKK